MRRGWSPRSAPRRIGIDPEPIPDVFAELGVEVIALEADAPVRLAALRADTGLKLPACCVLLAADAAAADGVLTFDAALARAVERLGLRA